MYNFKSKLSKGTLIIYEDLATTPTVIHFQHNPTQISRSLEPQFLSQDTEGTRISDVPVETIQAEIMLNATDTMEYGTPQTQIAGIYPQLCALELLIYPSIESVQAKTSLLSTGTWEVVPQSAPLVIFTWGVRKLPVKVISFNVTEETHDNHLNPIRAKVNINMRVLSSSDFPPTHKGYHIFSTYHSTKETLAQLGDFT